MKLTPEEITWVTTRLSGYDIKYQEVYDELKDHILTAIENLRETADTREVELLFNEVVKSQFPGWWPFEDIVKEYQRAYYKKVRNALWANIRYYLTWQTIPAMLLLITAGFYLPDTKAINICMIVTLLLISVIPQIYVYRAGRGIHTDKGKQSLVKTYVYSQANFLILALNILFNLIATVSRDWKPATFLNPTHYPPIIFMVMFSGFIIYSLACMRLSRQEFKIVK